MCKWIKASERTPIDENWKITRNVPTDMNSVSVLFFRNDKWYNRSRSFPHDVTPGILPTMEWLDESTPTTPSAMEEALRDKVIGIINKYVDNNRYALIETSLMAEDLINKISKIPLSAQLSEDGWVSVEDRLPEADKEVLVMYNKDGAKKIGIDVRITDEEDDGFYRYSWITHWQPLPKPPIH